MVTVRDMADLDHEMLRIGGMVGYVAVLCILVLAAMWHRRVAQRFTWSLGAPLVTFGLVAAAATLTLAYGWKGALGNYLHGAAEEGHVRRPGSVRLLRDARLHALPGLGPGRRGAGRTGLDGVPRAPGLARAGWFLPVPRRAGPRCHRGDRGAGSALRPRPIARRAHGDARLASRTRGSRRAAGPVASGGNVDTSTRRAHNTFTGDRARQGAVARRPRPRPTPWSTTCSRFTGDTAIDGTAAVGRAAAPIRTPVRHPQPTTLTYTWRRNGAAGRHRNDVPGRRGRRRC